jgi:RNA polymerase-binding protein DksA
MAPKKTSAKKTPAKTPVAPQVAKAKPVVKKPVTRPAPPAPPKKKIRAAKFTPDQLKKLRASLEEKKVELVQRQKELDEASFDATQSDITGEVGLDEDFADAGTATFERERDLSIRNNIRDLIDQVERAVIRIDDGKYGSCERCGDPIDATRLRELPHASLCLDCKRREERAR